MPDDAAHFTRTDTGRDTLRYEALIAPLLGDGYALAQSLSPDRGSGEDALQSAAFKAWQKLDHLRDQGSARAWFLTIVVNECKSSWRKRGRLAFDGAGTAASAWPRDVDARLDVRAAMRRLKRDDRVVLSLRFLMDMSVEESARVLGISPSAVKARTARASARFRELLGVDQGATE
jgi:DNA-directed RNA polymerase specialized sigma24 family protein